MAANEGDACGGGKTCQGGSCACPSGTHDCGNGCQQCCTAGDCPGTTCSPATCDNGVCGRAPIEGCCTGDDQCYDGNPCTTDTCVANTCTHSSVTDNTGCGTGQACCNGTCTPITTTSNCGTCGHTCPAGATCSNGVCFGGGCQSDAECTGCGDCQTGQCVITPDKVSGFCRCTNTPDCCTATVDRCQRRNNCDIVTCDTNSNTCVHTPVSCSGCTACNLSDGTCTFDTCPACQQCNNGTQCVPNTSLNFAKYPCEDGHKFCYNGQCISCLPTGDECTSNSQCCTDWCAPDIHLNGKYVCTCSISGFGTCTTNGNCCNYCCNSVGVCANFAEDLDNCGACGVRVPAGGICDSGNPTCTAGFHNDNGRCCPVGQSNCGSYCADLRVDINNCGTCGVHVPSGGVCNNGVPGCTPGFTNCGGTCTSLVTDGYNCGSCGHDCGYNGLGVHKGCCLGSCCLI